MYRAINGKRQLALGACIALIGGACCACNSNPKMTVSATPTPAAPLSPQVQNNPNVPAFVKNGGLDRMHQQMLDHARMLQRQNAGQQH